MLAARVLCTLLLGTFFVGGYGEKVAWGASAESTQIFEDGAHGDKSKVASAWGSNTTANNTASTAFGANTNASGEYSTAFGNGTVASGSIATAWGNSAKAYGSYSTAFGKGTAGDKGDNNKGELATAWGDSTVASGDTATVWGYHAKASGDFSTAFGSYTKASGMNSTAFGDTTEARGENATAWGLKAKAYGVNSTSLGYNTVAGGDGATAFGGGAMALGFYSTAWGYYTQAGQLLYGSDKTVAYIVDYTEGGTTKYKIVDYNNPETTLKGGFSSYWEAYKECDVKDAVQATAWGAGTKALAGNATAFGNGSIASGIRSTAFGWFTEASGEGSTTWGIDSVASGNGATAWGGYTAGMNQVKGGTASGDASTAFGIETAASGFASTAWGNKSVADGKYSTAFGDSSQAMAENSLATLGGIVEKDATNSVAIGNGAKVTVADAVALGSGSVASREAGATDAYLKTDSDTGNAWVSTHNAIAVGDDGTVTRQITGVAAGSKDTDAVNVAQLKKVAEGKLDKAVYEADKADTKAKLDGKANVALDNITEDGKTVIKDIAKGAVNVVGDGPVSVAKSDVSGVDTYTVSVKTDGKVESGDEGIMTGGKVFTETRVSADGNYIKSADSAAKNLEALDTAVGTTADGNYVKASDSVGENLGALDAELAALTAGTGTGLAEVSHRIDNMDSKVEKVGAGAAALAALHPMDTDGKFSMAAGFGNYRSANAMALGLFYRPTDQVMFSMGGSMGNGENMINAGVSFALDKGISTSKAAMARTIKAQGEKISEQDAKIQTLEAENAKLAERLAAIEAKLGK